MLRSLAVAAVLIAGRAVAQTSEYQNGVSALHAGDAAGARVIFEDILRAQPEDVDTRLQLGLSLLALGRLSDAEVELRHVLSEAPDYVDARAGLARVAMARRDWTEAAREVALVPDDWPEKPLLRRQIEAGGTADWRWAVDLDGSISDLKGGQRDWREADVQLRHRWRSGTTLGGAIRQARRFGRSDTYGEARRDGKPSAPTTAYVGLGGTPSADFLPRWQLSAGGTVKAGASTVLTLDARAANYRSGSVQTIAPGIDRYFAHGRAWLSVRWINIFDEDGAYRAGYFVRGDAMATDRLRLFAGYADAPDTSEGVVIDTRSAIAGASLDVGRTTWRLSLAHDDRKRSFDQWTVGFGVGRRF